MSPALASAAPPREQAVWHGLLAHDLKNALGLLEGQLEQLAHQPTAAAATRAHQQCRELRQRLVMMLTVSRAAAADAAEPAPGLQTWVTDEDPLALLHSVARSAAGFRPELSISVLSDARSPAFWTYDAHLVRMALDAATNNAMRFASSTITLSLAERDGGLSLQVLDDGPGLGGQPQWTPPGVGLRSTGIGMALCQAVASAHVVGGRKGAVRLSNRVPAAGREPASSGACFELWLP